MSRADGTPPRTGWARFAPELLVSDLRQSLWFWCELGGFTVAYQRPEEEFAYLERPEGIQLMLSQQGSQWDTGSLERPYGRGVMFQINVDELDATLSVLLRHRWPLERELREVWRRCGDRERGRREILIRDPDGYLVMVAEVIGDRPLS